MRAHRHALKDEMVSLLIAAADRSRIARFGAGPVGDGTPLSVHRIDAFRTTAFLTAGQLTYVVSSLGDDDVQEVARAMVEPITRALAGAPGNIPTPSGD